MFVDEDDVVVILKLFLLCTKKHLPGPTAPL